MLYLVISLIFIDVKGNGCKGHISTMYRPEPVNQMAIKEIYTKQNKDFAFQIMGTHPHQIHFEILSETGLFGFLSFTTFILYSFFCSLKSYFKNRNKYQLSALLFILCSLIPFLPSGSFFSTYTSVLFWLNFAIMTSYNKGKI